MDKLSNKEDTSSESSQELTEEEVKRIATREKQKDLDTLLHHLCISHELAASEDFIIYKHPEKDNDSEEGVVRASQREAYWVIFRDGINSTPPRLDLAFELLGEIKKGLELVMTPNIRKLRQQVSQVLDLRTLRVQAEHGAVDVMFYAQYIISIIAKICAPVRDSFVAQLAKETDIAAIFRGIIEILSLMKSDLLNFSLSVIKPDIMANHLAYERETYKEYLLATGATLPLTKQWLIQFKDPNKSTEEIFYDAVVGFLTWDTRKQYPETFFLEAERLRKLRLGFFRLTLSCTLQHLSCSLIPNDVVIDDDLRSSIKDLVVIFMGDAQCNHDIAELAINLATEIVKKIPSSKPQEFDFVRNTLAQAADPENKIRTLVCKRVKDYLRLIISAGATEPQIPPALNQFKGELYSLKTLFTKVFKHNFTVCMKQYEEILASEEETCTSSDESGA